MITLVELNELLLEHNCLRSIVLQMDSQNYSYDLILTLSISEYIDSKLITVVFADVSNLSMAAVGGGLTQFMHLQIVKLSSGLDRINYELNELEENKLSFNFASFSAQVANNQ